MPDITMPQLGETVTEGTITRWLKQVGDRVEEDEVIYEVSTDKVDSEVPSPVSGFLAEIRVPEGETAEVGAVLAVVSDAPPAGDGAGDGAAGSEPAPAEAQPETGSAQAGEGPSAGGGDPGPTAGTDVATADAGPEPTGATGGAVATDGAAPPEEADRPARPAPAEVATGDGSADGDDSSGGKVLSPVVRRLITEHRLDPSTIRGTGAGGRITRADVLAIIDRSAAGRAQAPGAGPEPPPGAPPAPAAPAAPQPEPQPQPPPPAPQPAAAPPAPGPASPAAAAPAETSAPAAPARPRPETTPARATDRDEVVPFSNIRRRTAEHMVRSLATSAHTLVVIEVDYDNVDRVRVPAKDRFRQEEGVSLTYLPFIARATIDAIHDFPHVNASVGDDELIVHRYVNLGIAVDMDFQGLIVPVVTDAESKRLRALAREMGDLGRRAKAKKLSADEISGGTFTITNAGGYGTLITGPIINQPQVAILSTDGIKPRPVAVALPGGGYGVAVHPVGNLAISFDHRAYDGAYASAFLARLKEILETRDWAAELG
ncbi:MAG: 2-oxo acid dehydrogenase subunit E2 [Actinobacteria bacterium]|nr:2-oxo acid dehydrogenase subunit E2 [Actinomycetota bacterium]